MELTAQHRKALLSELDKAKKDLDLQQGCLNKNEKTDKDLAQWFEIGCFLAQERIYLIEASLTNNDIDY